jgi:hypothetical protein
MLNNFPLLNSDKPTKLGNYASIPGTGPLGAVCSGCAKLQREGSRSVCGKFAEITRRKGKPIDTGTAACRYYVARQARLAGTAEEGSAA